MFGATRSGANSYAKVGIETGVQSASPHKLIAMLFDGALAALSMARLHMKSGNIAAKGQAISKAVAIINDGLRASLDQRAGGTIAANLDALYAYMGNQLVMANAHNAPETIDEVETLLADLKGAWAAIDPDAKADTPAPAPVRAALAGYDAPVSQFSTLAKA
jgi:flagellar protein FliS